MKKILIVLILSLTLVACGKNETANSDCVEVVSRKEINADIVEEAIGYSDNVFIAQVISTDKVDNNTTTLIFDGKYPIIVKVDQNIKGELKLEETVVNKVVFFEGDQINRDTEDFMPEVGKYYIFVTENIENELVANGNYTNNPKDGFNTLEDALNSDLYNKYTEGYKNEKCINRISN